MHRDRRSMSRPQLIATPYRSALSIACLLWVLFTARVSGENTAATVHKIVWAANVSNIYPPSSPLAVKLGDKLNISCPVNTTSNVWIQKHRTQYDNCSCAAVTAGMRRLCSPDTTIRQICQDQVVLAITFDSTDLNSALSFKPATTYYLISYSPGEERLAGFSTANSGGECLQGFKMALHVQSTKPGEIPGPNNEESNESSNKPETPRKGFLDSGSQGNLGRSRLILLIVLTSLLATTLLLRL